jgi:hypothetical protein
MSKRKAGEESDPSDKEEVVPPNKKAVASGDGNGVVACEVICFSLSFLQDSCTCCVCKCATRNRAQ